MLYIFFPGLQVNMFHIHERELLSILGSILLLSSWKYLGNFKSFPMYCLFFQILDSFLSFLFWEADEYYIYLYIWETARGLQRHMGLNFKTGSVNSQLYHLGRINFSNPQFLCQMETQFLSQRSFCMIMFKFFVKDGR